MQYFYIFLNECGASWIKINNKINYVIDIKDKLKQSNKDKKWHRFNNSF